MKRIFPNFLLIFLLIFPVNSYSFFLDFKPGSEPDGFRQIKWGTNISTIKDMVLIEDLSQTMNIALAKEYKKNNDILKIGSAHLKKLSYVFLDSKFWFVVAEFSGLENWKSLRDSCFKIFGSRNILIRELSGNRKDGTKYKEKIEDYSWEGDITSLSISYWHILNHGTFSISSKTIGDKAKYLSNKKLREKEGF
jgi:hypothetical protein